MSGNSAPRAARLRSTLAYLDREAARRAAGGHPGMIRLDDDELVEVAALIRREVDPGQGRAIPKLTTTTRHPRRAVDEGLVTTAGEEEVRDA